MVFVFKNAIPLSFSTKMLWGLSALLVAGQNEKTLIFLIGLISCLYHSWVDSFPHMGFPYILFPVVPTSRELCLLPSVASQPQTGGLASVMNYHDPPRDSLLLRALIVPRSPLRVRTVHSVWSCFCSCNPSKWLPRHCSSRGRVAAGKCLWVAQQMSQIYPQMP